MKILLQVVLLFCISLSALAQESKMLNKRLDPNFMWRNATDSQRDSFYFSLLDLKNSSHKTHIRITSRRQIVDLYSDDNIVFKGSVLNYILEYKESKEDYESSTFHFQNTSIDSTLASPIATLLLNSNQAQFPTDTDIKAWSFDYLHCYVWKTEFKQNQNYVFQSYSCLFAQNDTVPYKLALVKNHNLVDSILSLQQKFNAFKDQLSKGRFYSSDGYMIHYILTKNQQRVYDNNAPYREYLNLIKDTLNNFLSDTLTNLIKDNSSFNCTQKIFYLKFSKSNRLVKIESEKPFSPQDKLEINTCKKQLEKVFKNIRFTFVHSEKSYWKKVYVDRDKVCIVR